MPEDQVDEPFHQPVQRGGIHGQGAKSGLFEQGVEAAEIDLLQGKEKAEFADPVRTGEFLEGAGTGQDNRQQVVEPADRGRLPARIDPCLLQDCSDPGLAVAGRTA
jgi:hypothetical protein